VKDGIAVLRQVRELGGFFVLETAVPNRSWLPMRSLIDGSSGLSAHIDRTAAALAARTGTTAEEIERRVAASIMQQGLMARLLSPPIASAVLAGWVPRMQLSRMWWQPDGPGPIPMTLPDPHAREGESTHELAPLVSLLVIEEAVVPLVTEVERETQLSSKISWGNVASAVVGATSVLARRRPDLAGAAVSLCRELLRSKHLADAGDFEPTGQFRRRSCCLYYRLPNGGLCGDCVLAGEAG
jgi:hypothetical protein